MMSWLCSNLIVFWIYKEDPTLLTKPTYLPESDLHLMLSDIQIASVTDKRHFHYKYQKQSKQL